MLTLSVLNKNNELVKLTNSSMFEIVDIDGVLPSQGIINSSIIVTNDGALFNSSRLNTRSISISFAIKLPIEKNRIKLYEFFPVKKNVRLYLANGSREVYVDGYVESYDGSLFDKLQIITINFVCLDPYFKNKFDAVVQNSQVLDLFEFPFDIEDEGQEFSVIDTNVTQTILNNGDAPTGMIIELSASNEVVNPKIYNTDTREAFGINITMVKGDLIRINTKTNQSSINLVRGGQTFNIINNIERDSSWFKLAVGDNIFTFTCDSGSEFLNINFIHTDIYQGV